MFSFKYMQSCEDKYILGGYGKFGNTDWDIGNTKMEKNY